MVLVQIQGGGSQDKVNLVFLIVVVQDLEQLLTLLGEMSTRKIQDYMVIYAEDFEAAGTLVPEFGAGSRESQIRYVGSSFHEARDRPTGGEFSIIGVRALHEDPFKKGILHSTRSKFL
jgi:hypothetical protein